MGTAHTHRGGRRYNGRRGRNNQPGARGPSGSENSSQAAPASAPGARPAANGAVEASPRAGDPSASRDQRATPPGRVAPPHSAEREHAGGDMAARGNIAPAPARDDEHSGPPEREATAAQAQSMFAPPSVGRPHAQRQSAPPARDASPANDEPRLSDGKRSLPVNGRGVPSAGISAAREDTREARNGHGQDSAAETGHRPEPRPATSGFRDSGPLRAERVAHPDLPPHEPLRPEARGDVGPLIDALHELFERDRAVASQGGGVRCGICYLHFAQADVVYRDAEGFYVCAACARALGHAQVFMVRRQQQ